MDHSHPHTEPVLAFLTQCSPRGTNIWRMTPDDERSGDLLDVALRDEIELVSDLVVAASSSPRHFTPDEIDALLGIGAATRREGERAPQDLAE